MYVPWVASILLLIAVVPGLPYGYYQLLRWVVCGASCYGAFIAHEQNQQYWKWIFISSAIVFNPIFPIHLSRPIWVPVDIATSICFAASYKLFRQPTSKQSA